MSYYGTQKYNNIVSNNLSCNGNVDFQNCNIQNFPKCIYRLGINSNSNVAPMGGLLVDSSITQSLDYAPELTIIDLGLNLSYATPFSIDNNNLISFDGVNLITANYDCYINFEFNSNIYSNPGNNFVTLSLMPSNLTMFNNNPNIIQFSNNINIPTNNIPGGSISWPYMCSLSASATCFLHAGDSIKLFMFLDTDKCEIDKCTSLSLSVFN